MHFPVPKVASITSWETSCIYGHTTNQSLPQCLCRTRPAACDCWPTEWSLSHARLNISANGVWGGRFKKIYFDVRVLNPLVPTNSRHRSAGIYRAHEQEKKRAYEQCVQKVEHSSFTRAPSPVCHWRHGNEATTFFKCLASLLAEKWDSHYSSTPCWLRCRLSFSLLCSAIQAIRGAQSSRGHAAVPHTTTIDLITSESCLHRGQCGSFYTNVWNFDPG